MYQHANATPVPPSQESELEISPALDKVILACLAKHPEDRPQNASELSRLLAAAVPADAWSEDRAHRWWDRHHPAPNWAPPAESDHRMLTKTLDTRWEPGEIAASAMDSAGL
jgi:serine/threonine protein kinase